MRAGLPIHGKSVLFGLVLIAALASFLASQTPTTPPERRAHLAIEHAGGTKLHLIVATKSGAGLLELRVEGREAVTLSVPADWQETAAKSASGARIAYGEAGLGFQSIVFTRAGMVQFRTAEAPHAFSLENPAGLPVSVTVEQIDLAGRSASRDVTLSTDPVILLP